MATYLDVRKMNIFINQLNSQLLHKIVSNLIK